MIRGIAPVYSGHKSQIDRFENRSIKPGSEIDRSVSLSTTDKTSFDHLMM